MVLETFPQNGIAKTATKSKGMGVLEYFQVPKVWNFFTLQN